MQSLILRFDEDDAGVPARDAEAAAPGSRAVGFWDMTGEWMRDAPRARRVSRARVWHLPMRSEWEAFPRTKRRGRDHPQVGNSEKVRKFATGCFYRSTCTDVSFRVKSRFFEHRARFIRGHRRWKIEAPIAINRRQVTSVDRRNDPRARDWSRYE